MDVNGRPFCEIIRFEMKRIDANSALVGTRATVSNGSTGDTALQKVLRDAIMPPEGLAAFDRIMAQPHLVQCIASSMDIEAWDRSLDVDGAEGSEREAEDGGAGSFSRPDLEPAYEAAETDSEKLLARIWSELLGLRQIGVNDDFFQLGGHSLHAVRLFVALRKQYGVSLPLSTLFETPSIRPLAALLDAQSPQKRSAASVQEPEVATPAVASRTEYSSLVPIQPIGAGPAFYCAAGMGGNPLNLRALALRMGIDQPFYGLQPQGLDGMSKLHRTIPEMASHYIAEIRRRQPSGPYYLGGYSGGGVVAFEMAKQLIAAGERIGSLVFLNSVAPGIEMPSALDKLGKHVAGLRNGGVRYAFIVAKRACIRRIGLVAALARKPLRRLFPYHYRLENIERHVERGFRGLPDNVLRGRRHALPRQHRLRPRLRRGALERLGAIDPREYRGQRMPRRSCVHVRGAARPRPGPTAKVVPAAESPRQYGPRCRLLTTPGCTPPVTFALSRAG